MKTICPNELRKQQKALVMSSLQVSDNPKTPIIAKSVKASRTSELHHDGIIPSVEPFHKQQDATMIVDLEDMESPEMQKSKNASITPQLHRHGLAQYDDAGAQEESPSPAPVKILRSSTRNKAARQLEIPESWHLRSHDQQSRPAKRPISTSFDTVKTPKKPKPTTTKSKDSGTSREGQSWTADEMKIAEEAKTAGQSYEDIADLLGRTARGVQRKMLKVTKIWVPRTTELKLLWTLVIEKQMTFPVIRKRFAHAEKGCLNPILRKIRNGWLLTDIPTEPDNFLKRVRTVYKGEKFDHKDRRGVVYPQNSSEPFEYRWIDGELVIIDTINLLINVKPLLVWYPFTRKYVFIRPTCYAVVDKKASRWFEGEWVSILSGIRLYLLCGHWTDELEDLILFDNDGNRRQTHKDIVRPFKDDNDEIICSLCDLAFTSEDSYLLHAGLHSQGWPHIRRCCFDIFNSKNPKLSVPHNCFTPQRADVGPFLSITNRRIHGNIGNLLALEDTLTYDSSLRHDWDLLVYSVRWSSNHASAKRNRLSTDYKELVKAYEQSYNPTSRKVIKAPPVIRSSRSPILTHAKTAAKISELSEFFGKIAVMEPSSRILIMSQSLEGLTTNLQSLAFFARSMQHLRVTLGFSLLYPKKLVDLGQEVKGDRAWVFYDLQKLRRNINGTDADPRYMRVVTALFIIQKFKQQ